MRVFGGTLTIKSDPTASHSIVLAKEMRRRGPITELDVRICVVNDTGRELHVEMLPPNAANVPLF